MPEGAAGMRAMQDAEPTMPLRGQLDEHQAVCGSARRMRRRPSPIGIPATTTIRMNIATLCRHPVVEALARDLGALAHALRAGEARKTAARHAIPPPAPRAAFLPRGTPGMH
jgi:hypothetical protein